MTKDRKKKWVPVGVDVKTHKSYCGNYRTLSYRGGYNPTLTIDWVDFDSIISELQSFKQEYGSLFEEFQFRMETEEYDDTLRPRLYGLREENDLEYEVRLEYEAYRVAEKEESDRKQYELLKAKFSEDTK